MKRELSLFDSISIIVGIIIGAGIYETAPLVASCMGGPVGVLGVWLAGGLLALAGAFTYAQLATRHLEDEGGDYVYLKRAYGKRTSFLFAWSQLVIVRPGDIALMAFVFARYAATLYAPWERSQTLYAALAVVGLTVINLLGVKQGKITQNILCVAKLAGFLAVVGLAFAGPGPEATAASSEPLSFGGVKLALILVLFTFGGWHEIAYVAAEVKQARRNIVLTLLLGTGLVTLLYVGINAAFMHALGYQGLAESEAVAVDAIVAVTPGLAQRLIAVVICLSALGAVNGLTLTGARVSYVLGKDYPAFSFLGHWGEKRTGPVPALVCQGVLSLAIVVLAGSFVDTILYSAPVVWVFFLCTGLSAFVLKRKDQGRSRSFTAGYPVAPILFCLCCGFMLYNCVTYALAEKPWGLTILGAILIAGWGLHWRCRKAD